MKKEVGKPIFIIIIVVVVAVLGWFGWNSMETPENKGLNEEKLFRDAEAKAKSNGVDIKTIPGWTALYYKYHPEDKTATASAPQAAPVMPLPPAAPAGK